MNSQYIKDEDGKLLGNRCAGRERWVRCFTTLLNAKSAKVESEIMDGFGRISVDVKLGKLPSVKEVRYALQAIANNKAVGPQHLSAELLKFGSKGTPAIFAALYAIITATWAQREVLQK